MAAIGHSHAVGDDPRGMRLGGEHQHHHWGAVDGPSLSASQRRLWFLGQYDGDDAYVIARATRFAGPLDLDALREAHQHVADRHEILRTRYPSDEGVPRAVVDAPAPIDMEVVQLSRGSDVDATIAAFVSDAAAPGFDLSTGPVWRVRIGQIAADDHVAVTAIHHIAADGWSFPILRAEVSAAYAAVLAGEPPDLPPLDSQYADHVSDDPSPPDMIEYWAERFGDDPDPIPHLGDRARPQRRTPDGGWAPVGPLTADADAMRRVAARCNATPFIVGLAIFARFLGRLTMVDEVVVGIPHADRPDTRVHQLIGPFVNTLPLRIAMPGGATLVDQVEVVRTELLAALDNAIVPFEDIVRAAAPRRDASHTPLFQVMYQLHEGAFRSRHAFPGVDEQVVPVGGATSKFDLTLEMSAVGDVSGSLNFSRDIFDDDTAVDLGRSLAVMTDAALAAPDQPLDTLPLLDAWEQRWMLADLNATRRQFPTTSRLEELFVAVAEAAPSDIAIEDGAASVTYGTLLETACDLTARLREVGVVPGEPVAVTMDRSAGQVCATLAVLMCGGVYVPIDPGYPEARQNAMIGQAGVRFAVTSDGPAWNDFAVESVGQGVPRSIAGDGAYVMFTSGSTGTPKGVVVPHRAVVRLVRNTDYVDLGPGDIVAHASSTSFDASTFEVWGSLLNGATMRVFDKATLVEPRSFSVALRERPVSTMFVTTALFDLMAAHEPAAFRSVRDLLFGGERCDPSAVARILEAGPPERLLHVYGPTETTTFASWHLLVAPPESDATVPIGLPVANTTLHVLDTGRLPVPVGAVGELYIGGDGLAIGYLDDPTATSQCFVPDPFTDDPWGRLYRSGDLVRRRRTGEIEFVGRVDRQIKLRGYRIEPGEVEHCLQRRDDVSGAIVRMDGRGPEARLSAWVVPAPGAVPDPRSLVDHLRAELPPHMVPASIGVVDAFPIGPTGKIDDAALRAAPAVPTGDWQSGEPVSLQLARMIAAFESVLGVRGVGPHDSFFDLGGHSLLAVELVAAVESGTSARVPLAGLFENPTPSGLARLVDNPHDAPEVDGLVTFGATGDEPPLFLFHHPSGTVLAYRPLAERLSGRRPVFGVQARGVDGFDRPVRSIHEMALGYADRIEQSVPVGPIMLAGHSLGGLLAWETAAVLAERGRQVPFVALLDSRVPRKGWVDDDGAPRVLGPWGLTMRATRRIGGNVFYGARYLSHAVRRRPVPPTLARIRQIRASSRAFETYQPPSLDRSLTYFEAIGGRTESRPLDDRPEAAWAALAGSIEIVPVPGVHTGPDSLLAEPNVAVLGREMDIRITAIAAERSPVTSPGPAP